jgi:hypothetical protein
MQFRALLLSAALTFPGMGCEPAAKPISQEPRTTPTPDPLPAPKVLNDFDVSNSRVPTQEIARGGPPRDGIPAIDKPKFIDAAGADYMKAGDLVLAFGSGAEARAYPLRILVWHEIVNDTVAGQPIVVTYCPLCGTAMIFDRARANGASSFGVSGLLYKSDMLMYDRETESLWSQLKMEAVAGSLAGTKLPLLSSEQLTFAAWREKYPRGKVLSTDTGFERNYTRDPYGSYDPSKGLMFGVGKVRNDLPHNAWVIGFLVGETAYAVPLDALPDGKTVLLESAGAQITLRLDATTRAIQVNNGTNAVPTVRAYWFAWQAFNPETRIWKP